ncbi:GNAT family N-acetyltransferase [Bradyrhizobium sp.]|uniref:GNAT family N-acetyltransferase n=1 Tax=Bradyrhizobium sp. TaxID=376 RepID=UPI002602EB36|nr:GNAT family N-acetyltransferase [Bradyrhizobium sp.]
MKYQIVPLREQPHHLSTVAGWIHRQWWSKTDTPVEAIEQWLRTHLGENGFPATFIAVEDDEVLGSVSLHESEAENRPAYRPYLGAVFVKPDARGHGLSTALVRAVEARANELGHATIYLNAADATAGLYQKLGWEIVERGYGPKLLNIMRRLLPGPHHQAVG